MEGHSPSLGGLRDTSARLGHSGSVVSGQPSDEGHDRSLVGMPESLEAYFGGIHLATRMTGETHGRYAIKERIRSW